MKKVLGVSILILFILTGVMVLKSAGLLPGKAEAGGSEAASFKGSDSVEVVSEEVLSPETSMETIESARSQASDPEEDSFAGDDAAFAEDDSSFSEDTSSFTEDGEYVETREPLNEYDGLLDTNPYVSGWLRIEGAGIDAPVVYTPRSQNYFLHRDLSGNDKESGTLFIATIWREGYYNTLIYGHNMRDGTGFGSLGKFAGKKFALSHRTLRFDTLYETREYELLGAFYSQIEEEELETPADREERDKEIEEESTARKLEEEAAAQEEKPSEEAPSEEQPSEEAPSEAAPEPPKVELTLKDLNLGEDLGNIDIYRMEKDDDMINGRFRYYYFTDLTEKADYDYFIENVKKDSIYDTGVDASWGDELLTLSTCSYHVHNGRFVVVAKRVK